MSTAFPAYLYCLPHGKVIPLDSIKIEFVTQPHGFLDFYTMRVHFSWWNRGKLSNYQTKKILRRLILGNTRVRLYEQRLAQQESLTNHETCFLASHSQWTAKHVVIRQATDPAMRHTLMLLIWLIAVSTDTSTPINFTNYGHQIFSLSRHLPRGRNQLGSSSPKL